MKTDLTPPSIEDLTALAEQALETIPPALLRYTAGVAVLVEELPDDEICAELDLDTPFDILGLYNGVPFGERENGAVAQPQQPDMIFLYRRPILDYWCETGEELGHVVRHVLIHEIGHHFGLSDDDMDRIENDRD